MTDEDVFQEEKPDRLSLDNFKRYLKSIDGLSCPCCKGTEIDAVPSLENPDDAMLTPLFSRPIELPEVFTDMQSIVAAASICATCGNIQQYNLWHVARFLHEDSNHG